VDGIAVVNVRVTTPKSGDSPFMLRALIGEQNAVVIVTGEDLPP
jgi:hypothetical protein